MVSLNEPVDNAYAIIYCARVVAEYNQPMLELANTLVELVPSASQYKDQVANAVSDGATFFEALTKVSPKLANAAHDFVYQITHPHESIITKDLAIEQVIKVILTP